jgi:hypothetical protein
MNAVMASARERERRRATSALSFDHVLAAVDAAGLPRHADGCAWLACVRTAGEGGVDAMGRMVREGCPPCDCGFEAGPAEEGR